MKIPKTVRVLAHPYRVEFVDGIINPDRRGAIGQTCCLSLTIKLDKTQQPSTIAATFLHELLHAIDWTYFEDKLFSDDVEEKTDRLAEALHQVLSDMGVTFET